MRRLTAALVLMAALVMGCQATDWYAEPFSCYSDSECDEGEVCFPDGCGDPGKDIVVEVIPNPKAGLHAQDFQVDNLRSQQNIDLLAPATLQGRVRVQGTSSSGNYSAPITLRMTGESLLIPGVVRRHESTLVPDSGGYSLPVGMGRYNVTLVAADAELPPLSSTLDVQAGRTSTLDFVLPESSELVRLSGKIVKKLVGDSETRVDVDLEVQALDDELHALSQRVPVKRESGEFSLALPPSVAQRATIILQVQPLSAEALVPQKMFTVSPHLGIKAPLVMGDYGEPVKLRGSVLDQDGKPVSQATVSLIGKVGGGGQYRSQKVFTHADGSFELRTLPSSPDSVMTLSVVPPPSSNAGYTLKYISVPRLGVTQVPDIVCMGRMKVFGTVQKPIDSLPAAGVRVVAEPLDAVPGWPRPSLSFESSRPTDEKGRFEMVLDPGRYRFDFIPTEDLPLGSRIVTVRPGYEDSSLMATLELPPYTLSKGRRVTGRVGFSEGARLQPAAPYASIRFFRVVDVEGKRTALLLSQTLTDQNGNYSLTMPAH